MNVRKMRQIAYAVVGVLALSAPAFAQEAAAASGGGLDLYDMFAQMGALAWAVAIILFGMSFLSVGIAIERIYTFSQARKQSKLFAPQVAKDLRDQRLKEAIALSNVLEPAVLTRIRGKLDEQRARLLERLGK